MLVKINSESCDGNIRIPIEAMTCLLQVTGSYKAVDCSKYQDRWPHLRVCRYPEPAADPTVDLLIDKNQIDLHFAKADVR